MWGKINKRLKIIAYLSFIAIWFVAQYYKGIYVTADVYNGSANFIWDDRAYVILINVFAIYFFLTLISVKGFKTTLIIYTIIANAFLFGDILYGRYYSTPLSISLIDQITFLGAVSGSAATLVTSQDMLIWLDVLILLILSLYLKKFSFKIGYGYRFVGSFVMFLLFANMSLIFYEDSYTERYEYNKKEIGEELGVYTYHYTDFKRYIVGKFEASRPVGKEDLALIENANQANNNTNDLTGILEGKNVIVLQMEAFQNFVINEEINGIEVTPVLNSLIQENSIYASNFYYETAGGNTVDAELLTSTSMFPTYSGSAFYLYPNNYYISTPLILKKLGYRANSYHAYEGSFWNRQIMHNTLGYERYYSKEDFDYEEEDVLGWSLNDKKFLKESLDKTIEATQGDNFYSYMIMLTSHYPYEGFYNGDFTWFLGRTEGEVPVFERYLNSMQYVDSAIGEFIEYLKEKDLYEDTVIVIIGDHGGLFNDERLDMVNVLGLEATKEQYAKLETVPFIIHNPSLNTSITIDKVSGQKDIMATLGNLMNFDIPYTFGRDILDDEYEGIAIKRYGNVYTNDFIFLQDEETFYDFETLEEITEERLIEEYREVQENSYNLLRAAELIYKYDYLRKYK